MPVRTIKPEEFYSVKEKSTVIDVRREEDYEKSEESMPGASWKNPSLIDEWINEIPKDNKVIIFCVRGGGVSNSVVDRLLAEGIDASYIEGGIESAKTAGCTISK